MPVKKNPNRSALKKKASGIYDVLERVYGPQKCFLEHSTPFQLLAATILSAQCTDKMVNNVTKELFKRFPDASSTASAMLPELEAIVKRCGYYHAKAEHILKSSKYIMENYAGETPRSMEELLKLPGVGRKTANVVLSDAFGVPGLPVDTHVKRIMNLTGIVNSDDPEKIEETLSSILPQEKWREFSHLVIMHGRKRCVARRADCTNCEIREFCDSYGKGEKCR